MSMHLLGFFFFEKCPKFGVIYIYIYIRAPVFIVFVANNHFFCIIMPILTAVAINIVNFACRLR